MAHKTLVDGTDYEIIGGKTLVDGTTYEIKSGKTLVGGTSYALEFVELLYDFGTIECTTSSRFGYQNILDIVNLPVSPSDCNAIIVDGVTYKMDVVTFVGTVQYCPPGTTQPTTTIDYPFSIEFVSTDGGDKQRRVIVYAYTAGTYNVSIGKV